MSQDEEILYCNDDMESEELQELLLERNKQWIPKKDGTDKFNCSLHTVVLSCIDSRVPVEKIFQAKPGELLVLKNAGNLITEDIIRSLLVAIYEIGAKFVVILGHTACGMSILGNDEKITGLTEKLGKETLGKIEKLAEKDPLKWFGFFEEGEWVENAKNQVRIIKNYLEDLIPEEFRPIVMPALYDLTSGEVKFL